MTEKETILLDDTVEIEYAGNTPFKASAGASGYDLVANEYASIPLSRARRISTGTFFSIPEGYEGVIRGRSGLAELGIMVHLGTIDSDYRGDVEVLICNLFGDPVFIKKGDRIAQIVFNKKPCIKLVKRESLSETDRGDGGFGSTGLGELKSVE